MDVVAIDVVTLPHDRATTQLLEVVSEIEQLPGRPHSFHETRRGRDYCGQVFGEAERADLAGRILIPATIETHCRACRRRFIRSLRSTIPSCSSLASAFTRCRAASITAHTRCSSAELEAGGTSTPGAGPLGGGATRLRLFGFFG